MEEFHKEVNMLSKFRDEYLIHYYGSVNIPNKICMITEYAKYGSILTMIKHQQRIENKMIIKFMLDTSRGIKYLHSNGILHRDIKSDNVLIVSLNENDINCKLTDFGASRNISMLQTNMTFTNGIGTPIYMSPECLNGEHYKLPSDIYSFSILMYVTWIWKDRYPPTDPRFKFAWGIANFITSGKRLSKPEDINDKYYEIIENSWKQNPKERLTINEIEKELNELYEFIN